MQAFQILMIFQNFKLLNLKRFTYSLFGQLFYFYNV